MGRLVDVDPHESPRARRPVKPLGHRQRLLSLKYGTIEACFSVPMLQLTIGNLPFAIGFAVKGLAWSAPAVGLLAATPFIAYLLQPPLSHALHRRFSRYEIMRLTFVVNAAPWFLVLLFPFLERQARDGLFLALALTASLGNALCAVAWASSMSDLVPVAIRGRYLGNRNMIYGFWALVVTLLAGQAADATGNALWAFMTIYVLAACSRLVGLYFLTRMTFPPGVYERQGTQQSWASFLEPLRDPNLVRLLAFNGLFGLFLQAGMPFYAVFVLKELPYTLGDLTLLTTIASLGGLLSVMSWGPLIDRFGNKPVMAGGAAIWLTGSAVLWALTGPMTHWLTYPNYFLQGFTWAVFQLCQLNLMIKIVPTARKNQAISLYFAGVHLLTALGPVIGGWLLTRLPHFVGAVGGRPVTGYHVLIVGSLVLCLASLGLLWRVHEPAAGSVRELLRLVRSSSDFNPFLGLLSLAQHLFGPRGLSSAVQHAMRKVRRQANVLTDVGDELITGSMRALGSRTSRAERERPAD